MRSGAGRSKPVLSMSDRFGCTLSHRPAQTIAAGEKLFSTCHPRYARLAPLPPQPKLCFSNSQICNALLNVVSCLPRFILFSYYLFYCKLR